MTDWNKPTTSSTYANFVTELDDRLDDLALMFDGRTLSNLPTGAIRFNSSTKVFEKWDGSAWAALDTAYVGKAGSTSTGPQVIAANSSSAAFKVNQSGSGNTVEFGDATDPDSTPWVIDSSGTQIAGYTAAVTVYLSGVGVATPASQLIGATSALSSKAQLMFTTGTGADVCPHHVLGRSVAAVPTHGAVSSGQRLGTWHAVGSDGAAWESVAEMVALVDGSVSSGVVPGKWSWRTADVGGVIRERLTLDSAGLLKGLYGVQSAHATVGLGYATGAGGTVTQATSKASGVTLNKVSGQITMNAAALAAGAVVSFTLTNSAIAATDVPLVAIASAATAGAYLVVVDAVAAGSCRISVRNLSGGSLSEALVLNFSLMKGVTS